MGYEDLKLIYIRTKDGQSVNLYEASDQQFDAWAHIRATIGGKDTGVWSLSERSEFVAHLEGQGAVLYRVKLSSKDG